MVFVPRTLWRTWGTRLFLLGSLRGQSWTVSAARGVAPDVARDVVRGGEPAAFAPAAEVVPAWLAAWGVVPGARALFAGPGAAVAPAERALVAGPGAVAAASAVPASLAERALARVMDVPGGRAALAAPGGALVALVVQAELAAWVGPGPGRLAAVVALAVPLLPGAEASFPAVDALRVG
jgi:hypothetical protein